MFRLSDPAFWALTWSVEERKRNAAVCGRFISTPEFVRLVAVGLILSRTCVWMMDRTGLLPDVTSFRDLSEGTI